MVKLIYPPGPQSFFPIKLFLDLHRDSLGCLRKFACDYGDIVHMGAFNRHYYLLSHPDCIKQVLTESQMYRSFPYAARCLLGNGLLTSQGETHRQNRRVIQPFFQGQVIAEWTPTMMHYIQKMVDGWESGQTIDVARQMLRLTSTVVPRTLLGVNIEGQEEEITKNFEVVIKMTQRNRVPFMDRLLEKLPLPSNFRYRKALEALDQAIYAMIEERKQKGLQEDDLISALLKGSDGCPYGGDKNNSDRQIRDEVMTMFLSGYETTSNALSWAWHLLSLNPEAEAKLHEEIDAVLQGGLPTIADIPKLTYTRMVLMETMRLYPPVWTMSRRPTVDLAIGGFTIPAWSFIVISPFIVHRDPRFFPDPEKFDPMRWTPQETAQRPKFSYFPFGGGSRQCIGERFAMTEATLVIATIAQKWRLLPVAGRNVELEPLITLRPKLGMLMKMQKRIFSEHAENADLNFSKVPAG